MKLTVIDHITITTPTLEAGAKLVEKTLGVKPQKGGTHPRMGTHNLFLRLGESIFLEIIAPDPAANKPTRPRWFALDELTSDSPAKLRTWVARTSDIHSSLADCSEPIGKVEPMSRGATNWLITIPEDGSLPLAAGAPALIEWQTESHPASHFKNYGLSLEKLQVFHSEPDKLSRLLNSIKLDGNIEILQGEQTKIVAYINTPHGMRTLHS